MYKAQYYTKHCERDDIYSTYGDEKLNAVNMCHVSIANGKVCSALHSPTQHNTKDLYFDLSTHSGDKTAYCATNQLAIAHAMCSGAHSHLNAGDLSSTCLQCS